MSGNEELIKRCNTDHAAFRALVEQYKMRIFSFLIHLAGRQAADDLFQEVWLKVLKGASRYEPRGKPESWLFKIANNAALDHLRKRGRLKEVEFGEDEVQNLPSGDLGPLEILEKEEVKQHLEVALESLPIKHRQVFLMREFGRMGFKDVAKTLDIPLGTALSRMNNALAKLRARLEELHA